MRTKLACPDPDDSGSQPAIAGTVWAGGGTCTVTTGDTTWTLNGCTPASSGVNATTLTWLG